MSDTLKPAEIINTPYRLASDEEMQGCDDEVLSHQLRLYGVELIRLIHAGKLQAKDVAHILRNINQSLKEFGKPLLALDFLDDLD